LFLSTIKKKGGSASQRLLGSRLHLKADG